MIITYPLNGVTYDASDAETYLCTRTSGVFDSDESFALTITGGRTVQLSTGQAWIKNEAFAGKSVCSNTPVNLTFDLADSSLNRIDRIVLRFSKIANASELIILKGSPASEPTAPAIARSADVYDLGLYEVTVNAGAATITANDITDTRADRSVCGLMGDGVSGLNHLQQQIDNINRITHVNLEAKKWSGSKPYTQTVEVPGMWSTSEFWYYYDGEIASDAQAEAYGAITSAYSGLDTVTFSCYDEKPSIDIPIKVRGGGE